MVLIELLHSDGNMNIPSSVSHIPFIRAAGLCRCLALFVVVLFPCQTRSQIETGNLMGLITDGTGSAVPDAALTVSSASTSLQRTTKSNAYGRYFVPYLTPGKYELGVSKNAFKKAVVSAITLEVHQTARVDVSLEVGDIETTITVEAPAAATLQSDNTTVGGDIEQRALEELPGRDVFTSLSLSTNVANLRMHGFNGNVLSGLQPGSNRFLSANMNFGGQRQTANYYWLDGLSNTNWNINSMTNTPSVESLQEARVQVSTSSQQFGQSPGGIINVVTRAGTNDFHGEVYNYLRNDALDARPYNFSSEVQPKAPLRHNQFGASFGGQLISDKVFFFAHYEGLEARSRQEGSASPPTRRAREGDLTDYGRTIYDPLSASGGFRTPFPNNTIPRNRFSPVANKYLEFTPLPNVPGEIQRNFLGQRPSRTHNNQGNLRIDTQLARTDWLNGAFHVNDQKQNVEDVYNGITGTSTRTRAWNATLNETHVFSPSLINNFKIGYNRLVAVDGVYSEFRRDIIGELGIEGINRDPANWGFPSVFVSSIGFPVDSAQRPINQRDNLYHVLNDVTLLTGRHTLQFGGEFRKIELNYRQASPARGHFLFTNVFSAGPDPIEPLAETGLELADFLLGFPQQAVRTVGATQGYLRTSYAAGYVNDSIRINPRLTLMLGVRYGYQSPPREIRDNYFNLDFSTLPNPPELVRVGVDPSGLPKRGVQANRKNWSPLVGLAYRADSKTVVRAGYGIYYQHEMGAIYYNLVRNGIRSETNDSTVTSPQLDFDDAFRNPRFGLPSHHYIDPNAVTPYVQQWNFTSRVST